MRMQSATEGMEPILTNLANKAKSHWGYPPELMNLWRKQLVIQPGYLKENIVEVAFEGVKEIGFYSINIGTAELDNFWVDPEFIGTGIGKKMFQGVQDKMKEMGIQEIDIISDPNASGFYEKMGARRVGEVESVPIGRILPKYMFSLPQAEPPTFDAPGSHSSG